MERHFTVQMSTGTSLNFITVFDGNCTIPHGGTEDACIPLITIDFAAPLVVDLGFLHVKVTCTGEAAETPVFFEMYEDENSKKWPVLQLTIQSEVSYLDCTVVDQDGTPVKGAAITMGNSVLAFDAASDDDGKFNIRVTDNNVPYNLAVRAPGFPDYETGYFALKEMPVYTWGGAPAPDTIVINNRLDFFAGQQATIILPEVPNPIWGRYYRLDRHEGRDIIFVQELEPKADTPYVIFPYEDFSVSVADYNLMQREDPPIVPFPDTSNYSSTGFHGSYRCQPTTDDIRDGQDIYVLDTTPDCVREPSYYRYNRGYIGACRAYLVLGTYNKEMKYEGPRYVFIDESSDVSERLMMTPDHATYFDLQGRRLSGKPEKGVYIQDGKKRIVR